MELKDILWHYSPSLALCILGLILFALSALLHIIQNCKYRQKFFIAFALGTIFQVIGYLGRLGCIHDLNSKNYYVIQTLFILLAPIFYVASIYSMLGKIMQYIGAEDLSPIRPTRITCIFVIGDLISFILQGAGGSMEARNDANMTMASHIILFGLSVQLVFFFFFIFLTFVFHSRTRDFGVRDSEGDWRRLLHILEASSVLIFVRSVYRIVQFAQGFEGYLISHEAFLYIFDALLMLIVQLLFSFVHPGTVFEEQEPENKDIEMAYVARRSPKHKSRN